MKFKIDLACREVSLFAVDPELPLKVLVPHALGEPGKPKGV